MISRDDVKKLAELSLLKVDDTELDKLTTEIDAILGYVSEVNKLTGKEAVREKQPLRNVMRDDEVTNEPRQYSKAILEQAPDRDHDYIRVKKIL